MPHDISARIHRGRLARLTAVAALSLVAVATLAGCGSAAEATPSPSPVVLEVTLDDTLRMTPDAFTVTKNVPVRFVVTNAGTTEHEFVLGDEAMQAEHEQEMAADPGMAMHGHSYALMLKPGETKALDWRFETVGETYAGCHYPGHYAAGMKATITVTE